MVMLGLGRGCVRRTIERIGSVHAPTIQNTYLEGVGRTMERTTGAHNALFTKGKFAIFADMDIMGGTSLFAFMTENAGVRSDAEEPAVDTHGDMFYPKEPSRKPSEEDARQGMPNAAEDFSCLDRAKCLCGLPHLDSLPIGMTEDHIIRHNVMIFALQNVALFS